MDPACAQVPGWVGPDYSAAIQEEDVTFAFGVAVRWRLLSTVIYCYLLLSTVIYTLSTQRGRAAGRAVRHGPLRAAAAPPAMD